MKKIDVSNKNHKHIHRLKREQDLNRPNDVINMLLELYDKQTETQETMDQKEASETSLDAEKEENIEGMSHYQQTREEVDIFLNGPPQPIAGPPKDRQPPTNNIPHLEGLSPPLPNSQNEESLPRENKLSHR